MRAKLSNAQIREVRSKVIEEPTDQMNEQARIASHSCTIESHAAI